MEDTTGFLFPIAILVMSVVIHEVSHGVAAYLLGDKTAKYAGRLTLNPIPHIDILGSIIVPFVLAISSPFVIGWAKPVPYNPYNLRDQKRGPAIVGAAGPLSNFFIAGIFGFLSILTPIEIGIKTVIARAILFGGFFNTPYTVSAPVEAFYLILLKIVLINIILGVFNLLPIPPLDGSKVLFAFIPYQWYRLQSFLEQYGFLILIVFILLFSGVIGMISAALFEIFTGL